MKLLPEKPMPTLRTIKLWLDDARPAPEGWVRAVSADEAKDLVEKNIVEEMSLDHDLGTSGPCVVCREREQSETDVEDPVDCRCQCHRQLAPDGYSFVRWMVEHGKWPMKKPLVHSQNPVGAQRMRALIDDHWFNPQIN